MDMGIRDIVYIGVYLVTISVVWSDFKNSLNNTKNDVKKLNDLFENIVFTKTGGLNLVSTSSCKELRQEIKNDIVDIENTNKQINNKLSVLSDNILVIMTELKIDKKNIKNPNMHLVDL